MSETFQPPRQPRPTEGGLPERPTQSWPVLPGHGAVDGQYPPCEIETTEGLRQHGELMALDEVRLQLRLAPGRVPTWIPLSELRQLRLLAPLRRQQPGVSVPAAQPYRLRLPGGAVHQGLTLPPVRREAGWYLFEPLTEPAGAVLRVFVPHAGCLGLDVGADALAAAEAAATPAAAPTPPAPRPDLQQIEELLAVRPIDDATQLEQALEAQARMPQVRIGEALVALGLITPAQVDAALAQQTGDRSMPLGELLVRAGAITRAALQGALARKMGYPVVDIARFPAEAEALRRLPMAAAKRLCALPLLQRGSRLVVALEDPSARAKIEELQFITECKVLPVIAPMGQLERVLPQVYERFGLDGSARTAAVDYEGEDAGKLLESLEQQQDAEVEDGNQIEQSDNSLVRLINKMIVDALQMKASDIHIESQPGREKVRIRLRKDGVLRPYLDLPHTYRSALVARIKIMCDLDIAERRKPQDGKINFARFSPQHKVELRVATIPTTGGLEDVVLRLLASARPIPMEKLGLSTDNYQRLRSAIERPYGMVLCVGPTGSGKTTTLHSTLSHINLPDRKIWTAEDPIEITQPGLRQVQVNPKIDWTFERALRAFLRADPDVIMVGEIRDRETAQTAIEASLTGHLVLSTLHTNSAPETVTRLLDMGMDPFNFADSLLGVLAQRLVRRLCPHCSTRRDATDAEIEELQADWLHAWAGEGAPAPESLRAQWHERFGVEGRLKWTSAPGCARCEGSGWLGRVAIHELMTMSRELRRLVQTGAPVERLQLQALHDGMRNLRQDGIDKVLQGLTTIAEVRATSNV